MWQTVGSFYVLGAKSPSNRRIQGGSTSNSWEHAGVRRQRGGFIDRCWLLNSVLSPFLKDAGMKGVNTPVGAAYTECRLLPKNLLIGGSMVRTSYPLAQFKEYLCGNPLLRRRSLAAHQTLLAWVAKNFLAKKL